MIETFMKGHTTDFSTFCEDEWNEWVMYNDKTWKLIDKCFVLGWYLVPTIDVGSAMIARIIRKTGKVFPWSTIWHLMIEHNKNPKFKEQRCNFDEYVIAKLGDPDTKTDFPNEDLTPTYDAYVDDITEGKPNSPDKDLYPMP